MKQGGNFFIALLLLSQAVVALEIEERVSFSKKMAASQMRGGIEAVFKRESYEATKNELDKLLAHIKRTQNICTGGEYYIYPQNRTSQGAKRDGVAGYEGRVSFECNFSRVEPYDAFLANIGSFVKDEKKEKLYISPIRWELTLEQKKVATDGLKKEAIAEIKKRGVALSVATATECKPKKISFESGFGRTLSVARAELKTEEPIPRGEEVVLDASVLYECGAK